jgi:hypothetical protein
MIGTLPSCHAPSKKVQVSEKLGCETLGREELTVAVVCAIIVHQVMRRPIPADFDWHYRRN